MEVSVGEHFMTVKHDYPSFSIELVALECQFIEATFEMTDHDNYEWVSSEELLKWQLAEADIPIARDLARNP